MKRILLSAILIGWIATGVCAAQTAAADPSAPLDLQGYTTELARWSALTQRLGEHPEEAAALRKQLPDHWSVTIEEQRFQISTEWLEDALDGLAANPELAASTAQKLGDRLAAMLRDSEALARHSPPASRQARVKLDEILKRREYRSVHAPSQGETLWDQLTDWALKFLDKIFNGMEGHPTATKVLLWGVVILMGLVFLGWLVYSLTHLSLAKYSFRRTSTPAEPMASPGSWREWAERARDAAAHGAYRDAIRIIYGAAVRRIEAAGTWQLNPSRTHREYVRLLPANSLDRPPLVAITTCYERVWYGRVAASAADYESALAELESLP